MRAPAFWHHPNAIAAALSPLAWLYRFACKYKQRSTLEWKASVPVVCVGNVVAGGAGKTPLVLLLATYLHQKGIKAFVVSRGYGGALAGPVRVDHARHTAADVGDEPMLIAGHAPCVVAKDRKAGIELAIAAGAEIIVFDDGLQNFTVSKQCSLLVIDGEYGLGNGRLIPAGPLRETLADALMRVQGVVLMGEDKRGIKEKIAGKVPLLQATLETAHAEHYAGKNYVAFAGIGRPEKFFTTLRQTGAVVKESFSFADHHVFSETELKRLAEKAARHQAILITTEKDFSRLPHAWQKQVKILPVTLRPENKESFEKLLAPLLVRGKVPV